MINSKSDKELAAEIPEIITSGLGIAKAAKALHIGVERLKRITTEKQLSQILANGSKNLETSKQRVDIERHYQTVLSAIENGWGINETLSYTDLSRHSLKRYATPEQYETLKENGLKKGENYRKTNAQAKRVEGIRIIRDPVIAKAMMQEIIANHPAINR